MLYEFKPCAKLCAHAAQAFRSQQYSVTVQKSVN